MILSPEMDAQLFTLEDALTQAFGGFEQRKDESFHAECCDREVGYKTGIFGPDMAKCSKCGAKILNVLSPHVSPFLIQDGTTGSPNEEFIEAVGDRQWMVVAPWSSNDRNVSSPPK